MKNWQIGRRRTAKLRLVALNFVKRIVHLTAIDTLTGGEDAKAMPLDD
jgi:hypothetical protein